MNGEICPFVEYTQIRFSYYMDDPFVNTQINFYHMLYKDEDIPDFLIRQVYNSDQINEYTFNDDEEKILYMSEKINQICDLKINDSPIQFEKGNIFEDKKVDSMLIGKRFLDLHGYTKLGSLQASRRILLLLDRNHPNVVKFNVGIGSHSEPSRDRQSNFDQTGKQNIISDDFDLHHTTRNCVKVVCNELNLPPPQSNPKNKGYLIERLPANIYNENM